jgi:hypothetical protein
MDKNAVFVEQLSMKYKKIVSAYAFAMPDTI